MAPKIRQRFVAIALVVILVLGWMTGLGGYFFQGNIVNAAGYGDGLLLYGASGNSNPQFRNYVDASNSFSSASGTVNNATPMATVIKTSATKVEAVAGYADNSGNLQIMCYDGTTWTEEWSVTIGGNGSTRRFDIAYESTSGDVMVLYSTDASSNELAYRTKAGASACGTANWAAATNIESVRTTGVIHWVKLAVNSVASSNLIAAAWADANSDLSAQIWSGSAWGNEHSTALTTTMEFVSASQDIDSFDLIYESISGDLMVVWGHAGQNQAGLIRYAVCTGNSATCTWGSVDSSIPTVLDAATSLDINANPLTDEISMAANDNGTNDLSAGYWSGSAWTGYANLDISSETVSAGNRTNATVWVTNGANTRWVIMYDDANGSDIDWFAATPGSAPTQQSDTAASPGLHDVRSRYVAHNNPFDNSEAMFLMSDVTSALYAKQLSISSIGTLTWSGAEGGSSLGTLSQHTTGAYSFSYWKYIPPASLNQSAYRIFSSTPEEMPNWWNFSWTARRKITLNNSASSENLTDFPIRVSLTSSNIDYNKTQNSGQDIRFVDSDNTTLLNHEIELWDESDTSEVWVKVPLISAASTTDHIWMYYGNNAAPDAQNSANVWSGHEAVWHMNNDPSVGGTGQLKDSTSNAHHATTQGGMLSGAVVDGQIGKAMEFDGVDDLFQAAHDADLNLNSSSFTIQYWVRLVSEPEPNAVSSLLLKGNATTADGYNVQEVTNSNQMRFRRDGSNVAVSTVTVNTTTLKHFAHVYDSAAQTVTTFANGSQDAQTAGISYPTNNGTDSLSIGGSGAQVTPWVLDEIRISLVGRSAEWLEAEELTMTDSMNSFGEEHSWWNTSWNNRRKIILNNSASTENLVNFPIRVSLSDDDIDYANTQDSGQDVRFVDADGSTVLSHEIEVWDETGTSEVWVKVPQIDSGSTTDHIWLYYGNSGASDGQNITDVWSNSYAAVWHMHNDPAGPAPQLIDSTSNNNDATSGGSMTTGQLITGSVGKGIDMDGANDYFTVPDNNSLDLSAGFATAYIKREATGTRHSILAKADGSADGAQNYAMKVDSTNVMRGLIGDGSFSNLISGSAAITNTSAYYGVGFRWSAGNRALFVAGAQDASANNTRTPTANTGVLNIGQVGGGSEYFNGVIDEIRISSTDRSNEWAEAEYISINNAMNTIYAEIDSSTLIPLGTNDNPVVLGASYNNFILRTLLHVSTTVLQTGSKNYKLQVAVRSNTCDTAFSGETYADVSPSSGDLRFKDNADRSDGDAIITDANDPSHSGHSLVHQTYEESNNFTSIYDVSVGEDGVWEFALADVSSPWNTSYCFRVVESDNTELDSYTVIPEVTFCSGSPPISATLRHGKAICNGSFRKFYWNSN